MWVQAAGRLPCDTEPSKATGSESAARFENLVSLPRLNEVIAGHATDTPLYSSEFSTVVSRVACTADA
jgi:hypothetical protein